MKQKKAKPFVVREFAKRLKKLRLEQGLTQETLGARAELHSGYLSALERGEKGVSLETAQKLADGFQMELTDLLNFGSTEKTEDRAEQELQAIIRLLRRHDAATLRRVKKAIEALTP